MPVNNNALASLLGYNPVPRPKPQNALLGLLGPGPAPDLAAQFHAAGGNLLNQQIGPSYVAPQMNPTLGGLLGVAMEAAPGVGDSLAIQDFNKANQVGDRTGATLAAASLIPGVGELAAAAKVAAPWLKMGAATTGSLGGLLALTSGGGKEASRLAQMYPNQMGVVGGTTKAPRDFPSEVKSIKGEPVHGPSIQMFAGTKPADGKVIASHTDKEGYKVEIVSGAPMMENWRDWPDTYQRQGTMRITSPNGERVESGYWMNSPEEQWGLTQQEWQKLSWEDRATREAEAQATDYAPLKSQFLSLRKNK